MGRAFTIAALLAFLIDQISKYVVIHAWELSRIRAIEVLPPWLNFRYGENRGINFGLFGDGSDTARWFLIGLALVICGAVTLWLRRTDQPRRAMIGGGLLVGGALANVLDRVLYGYVLDFLNNPFVFNVADIFIFAGAIALILFSTDKTTSPKTAGKKRQ
jgi:signal peptidase II